MIITKSTKKNVLWSLVISFIVGFAIACVLVYWRNQSAFYPLTGQNVIAIVQNTKPAYIVICTIVVFVFFYVVSLNWVSFKKNVFKYRYAIAVALLTVCVLFEINGSSIQYWQNYGLGADVPSGNLLGMTQAIRSDEWGVTTPYTISQFSDSANMLPYFSDVIRGTPTDVFLMSSLPVMDIAILFRPFYWGYLFLGAAKGLAFFWCARMIALFMVTFEMGRIITGDNRLLSVMMAIMVALAPAVQWWFSAGGLVELLVFGQLGIILIYKYFETSSYKTRIIYALVLVIAIGSFLFTLYPAWEVPMAYVVLAFLFWIFISNRKKKRVNWKFDFPIFLMVVVLLLGVILYILQKSRTTWEVVTNTAYPGSNIFTGGGGFSSMFQYPHSIFLPHNEVVILNKCEISRMIDFAPMGWIVSAIVLLVQKRRDVLLYCLLAVSAFFTVYIAVGFSEGVARATLLSNASIHRILIINGFLNIVILIRALSLYKGRLNIWVAAALAVAVSGVVIMTSYYDAMNFVNFGRHVIAGIVLAAIIFSMLLIHVKKFRYIMFCLVAVIMLISGLFVNPVRRGIDLITESRAYHEIQSIVEEDKQALWMVYDNTAMSNYPIMAGARTINSTNAYPYLERWYMLDPERKYEDLYNRYAHIQMRLSDVQEPVFALNADVVTVDINTDSLQKLGVEYIFSLQGGLEKFSDDKVYFEEIVHDDFYIYHVEYM